jgi:hypothetical protein
MVVVVMIFWVLTLYGLIGRSTYESAWHHNPEERLVIHLIDVKVVKKFPAFMEFEDTETN